MKKELEHKNKYLNKNIVELATDMINKDKLDKHILMQILGIRNKISLSINMHSGLYSPFVFKKFILSLKLDILKTTSNNIKKSKMSKIEKEYLFILLHKALQFPY